MLLSSCTVTLPDVTVASASPNNWPHKHELIRQLTEKKKVTVLSRVLARVAAKDANN